MGIKLKNGNYFIDYYANGRRIREKIGSSKTLAENALRKRKLAIAENKFLDVRKQKKVRFNEFAKSYLETYSKPNKKSWESDMHNLKRLSKVFGNMYLYNITPRQIEEFKARRKSEVSSATVNREISTLKTLFNKAIEWGVLEKSPAQKIKKFKENNIRLRYLEKEEVTKLLKACRGYLRPIVIVALNTGMRRGEILGLKWQDIDVKRGIIYLLDTKNGYKREIPMNEPVKKALIRVHKHPESPYVFCKKDGTPFGKVHKSFLAAMDRCGIIGFHFHDLRHTFASQLVMCGVDLNTVRELLGHRDLKMTLRYAHLSPDHKRRAVDILGKKMDTFWTLSSSGVNAPNEANSQPLINK